MCLRNGLPPGRETSRRKFIQTGLGLLVSLTLPSTLMAGESDGLEFTSLDTSGPGPLFTHDAPFILKRLVLAYPEHIRAAASDAILWQDGSAMKLRVHGDKKFMGVLHYPVGPDYPTPPPKYFNPGCRRYTPFFLKMYGLQKWRVQKNLTAVRWMPKSCDRTYWVTKVNGVAEKFASISAEMDRLPDTLKRYVLRLGGTFFWRRGRGSRVLSPHSFGMAVDINSRHGDYWRWRQTRRGTVPAYRNRIPWEIVEIFEKYGFIWGGKWHKFDTMHFEYRPEFFVTPKHIAERRSPFPTDMS